MTANRYYHGPQSDHFDGERFFNPDSATTDRGMIDVLRWRFTSKRSPWPMAVDSRQVVPAPRVERLTVTMVGHATFLIQVARRNILVDPVWSQRVSPFRWAGPRRVNAPGIAFEELPPVDVVLLTHNHYDHLDIATLTRVWQRDHPRIVAPLGNDAVVRRKSPSIVIETADWGESIDLGADLVVRIHAANHWSARGMGDRRMALWCGFAMQTPAGNIYVVGDTGYGSGRIFRELKHRFAPLDLAIIPIGSYEPRWFMKDQHVDPDEAVQIMIDCGARQALGVHWGTFQLTDEARLAPRERLHAALARRGLQAGSFVALEPGDVWSMSPSE
jgi:L-ascorbate metabolism protein UlaG (beta-lactamase superfamily)